MPQISQIQVAFSPLEDRLLLRVNTGDRKEFRFWITRRYLKLLWPVLLKMLADNPQVRLQASVEARQTVLSFLHEQAISQADFSREFEESDSQLPLGSTPLLLARIQVKHDAQERQVLCLHPEQGKGLEIAVNDKLLHALSRLIIEAATGCGWDLALVKTARQPADERETMKIN
jgi:hypothetical protein